MDKFIVNPVQLKFDPKNSRIDINLQSVFENKLARTLWMGIKQRHLTSQYFEGHCLNAAKALERDGVPDSAEKLGQTITRHFGNGYSKEFITELFPYIKGEKDLEYEIVK